MQKKYAGSNYEKVVSLYADDITRMCVVWTNNAEVAKDCFQNTFLKLYQTDKEFQSLDHIKAWLLTVARNECNDYHRTFWSKNVDLGYIERDQIAGMDGAVHVASAEELIEYDEDTRKLIEALHKLTVRYREVLTLYYYEEYDTKEIAEILHISVNTVKSRLRRGRVKLAAIMQKRCLEEEE